jgi:hypothetical protein
MSSEAVHVFVCGTPAKGALFAVTNDRTGSNLPRSECPTGWAFEKSVDMCHVGTAVGSRANASAAIADLSRSGYHIFKADQ